METGVSGQQALQQRCSASRAVSSPAALVPCSAAGSQGCLTGLRKGPVIGLGASLPGHPVLIPPGGEKSGLGQKALAVCAWSWPADLCAGGGDRAPAADPSLLPCGWSQPPSGSLRRRGCPTGWWHVLPRRGAEHGGRWAWEHCAALAPLRWASAGWADSPPRSSCCPAKFLFFSENSNSVPGKNKWERSRCLALGRAAAGAQPWPSVENTNSRAGPVPTHKPVKANSKNYPL